MQALRRLEGGRFSCSSLSCAAIFAPKAGSEACSGRKGSFYKRGTEITMLRRAQELKGHHVSAEDGELGVVDGFYFDDRRWGVRFLVVATAPWPVGHKLLVPPRALAREPLAGMRVRMTR